MTTKNETPWTPGPWRSRDIGTKWAIYANNANMPHATVDRDGADRGAADARLIAAAPELVAEVQHSHDTAVLRHDHMKHACAWQNCTCGVADTAQRTARLLARVRGE